MPKVHVLEVKASCTDPEFSAVVDLVHEYISCTSSADKVDFIASLAEQADDPNIEELKNKGVELRKRAEELRPAMEVIARAAKPYLDMLNSGPVATFNA